jgi:hypothetical protein
MRSRLIVTARLWSRGLLAQVKIHLTQQACGHFYVTAEETPWLSLDDRALDEPDVRRWHIGDVPIPPV